MGGSFPTRRIWVENSTCMRTASNLTKPQINLTKPQINLVALLRWNRGAGRCLCPWKTFLALILQESTQKMVRKWKWRVDSYSYEKAALGDLPGKDFIVLSIRLIPGTVFWNGS